MESDVEQMTTVVISLLVGRCSAMKRSKGPVMCHVVGGPENMVLVRAAGPEAPTCELISTKSAE